VAQLPLRILLIGGPSSGKGTIAPMLSHAFRARALSVGQLLRGEARARTQRGRFASEAMARGELLSDALVFSLLLDRLGEDAWHQGWLIDGFPRSAAQARALLSDAYPELRPDVVVLLNRPRELVKEFMLGRMTDTATGQTYHPTYAPPPAEVGCRLVWRVDDVPEVVERRIKQAEASLDSIARIFSEAGVPVCAFDNARSELETFAEIAAFVEGVASARGERRDAGAAEEVDVEALCDADDEECVAAYAPPQTPALLYAVARCNEYDAADFLPVLVGGEQVGWVSREMHAHLTPYLAQGRACELVTLNSREMLGHEPRYAVSLAPDEVSERGRTETVAALVAGLVADGVINSRTLRHELQDVRAADSDFGSPPLLRIERAAVVYFGVPSYGVHVNGYVRDPKRPDDPTPHAVWVGVRAMCKATYPGLYDQMAAGGQPSGMSLLLNAQKEVGEEASLPPDAVARMRPTGAVSYRYATRKGLSTKRLATFDLELPSGLSPLCSDGEVEHFELVQVDELLHSLRTRLAAWKPNSALVAVDFAVRHGLVSPDEPGYFEIVRMLRAGG